MPTDPATVQPMTEKERASIRAAVSADTRYTAIECAITAAYALAVSRVDTAEVERRAGYNALTFLMENTNLRLTAIEACDVRDRHYAPAPAPRECVLSVYGPYSVSYTGAMPCPYRIQRGGVEVFACALASQASAWLGKQDDGFHLDDAQMGKLLAFAAEVGQ